MGHAASVHVDLLPTEFSPVRPSYRPLLLPRLAAIGELATRFITEVAGKSKLNATQWLIAFHLDKNASETERIAMSPKRLASLMMCPQTRVVTQLVTMRRKGLIEPVNLTPTMPRRPLREGRKFYALTSSGLRLIRKSVASSAEADELFAALVHSKVGLEIKALHKRLEDASLRDCLDSISVLEVALREQRIKKARR